MWETDLETLGRTPHTVTSSVEYGGTVNLSTLKQAGGGRFLSAFVRIYDGFILFFAVRLGQYRPAGGRVGRGVLLVDISCGVSG